MFFFVLFFWFSRRFLENPKSLRENQKYKRKPKKIKTFGKTKTTKFLKVSDPPLDMGLFFLFLLVFPEGFYKAQTTFDKTQHTKENQRNQKSLRENQKNKVFKCFRLTLGYGFVFFCFVLFSRIFVCFRLFSLVFLVFSKVFLVL